VWLDPSVDRGSFVLIELEHPEAEPDDRASCVGGPQAGTHRERR
jgi:hypothetical protein